MSDLDCGDHRNHCRMACLLDVRKEMCLEYSLCDDHLVFVGRIHKLFVEGAITLPISMTSPGNDGSMFSANQ